MTEENKFLTLNLTIPFPSEREALIAYNSLRVDKEPGRGGSLTRQLDLSGSQLCVRWHASEARLLRVSVNGFLDHLALVTQTIAEFDVLKTWC
jgi:EKC/KEOPS complex subunit PCC1/LAGE3